MTRARLRSAGRPEDRGAALILAVCFVVMVGAISGGLAALITSSLHNSGSLQHVRDREYAADGAIQTAITIVRPIVEETKSSLCSGTGSLPPLIPLNGISIGVDVQFACAAVRGADGTLVAQRNVIFTACEMPATAAKGRKELSRKGCANRAVIIRTRVNFEQGPTGTVTGTYVQTWSVDG